MRRFLALMFLTLLLASATNATAQELFEYKTLGLKVEKPKSWHVLTDAQNRENLARTQMSDAEFQAYVQKHARAPIFAITKYREPYNDLNPSIKITIRPAGGINKQNLLTVTKQVVTSMMGRVGKVQAMENPKLLSMSGFPATYTSVDYTLKTQDGLQFPVKSQMWFILKKELLVMVGAGTRQDEKTGSRQEIQKVIDSIRLN